MCIRDSNKTPEFGKLMHSAAEALHYPTADIGVYLQPVHQGIGCHYEFYLPYDPNNEKEAASVRKLLTGASEKMAKQGAFFSRPYGIWADMAYRRDKQATLLLKKLKGIFDPNNVMNPQKLCF